MVQQNIQMKQIMKGATILTIAAFIVKVLSAIYRVPFQNLVGDRGFYIYQQIYPFIGMTTVWISYGLSVALSKMLVEAQTQKEYDSVKKIVGVTLFLLTVILFLFFQFSGEQLAKWMGDSALAPLLQALSFMMLFVAPLTLFKGEKQAMGDLNTVAISNILEQLVRVVLVIVGAYYVMKIGNQSIYDASFYAVIGSSVGLFVAFLYLYPKRERVSHRIDWTMTKTTIRKLFIYSLSFSASAMLLLFYQLVDAFTILNGLMEYGTNKWQAMDTKGIYDRGQPFVQLGILLSTTLSLTLPPLITHYETGKMKRAIEPILVLMFKIALVVGIAATVGLLIILPDLNELLFMSHEEGLALSVFISQIFFLSLILPLAALLFGSNQVGTPLLLFLGSIGIKGFLNTILLPIWGIVGAAVASVLSLVVVLTGLVVVFNRTYSLPSLHKKFYQVVGLATLCMILSVKALQWGVKYLSIWEGQTRWHSAVIVVGSVGLGAAVFLSIILRKELFHLKEWMLVPGGRKMAKLQLSMMKERANHE